MSKIGRAGEGPSPQSVPEEINTSTMAPKPADVRSPEAECSSTQPTVKNGGAKILEGKMQGILREALLQKGADKAQGLGGKSEIGLKLAQVDYKLKMAQDMRDKLGSQIQTVQKEVARIQGELGKLKAPLNAAGEERKQMLERQVDQLLKQTNLVLAGAGVDLSKTLPANASLADKLRVLGGIKNYAGDAVTQAEKEIADLQSEKSKLQAEKMNRKNEIGANIEETRSKIQDAIYIRDKVTTHLSGLQEEMQGVGNEIREVRNQMEQLKKTPGDVRDPQSPKAQMEKELKMKEEALESKLNHLIDQTQATVRDTVKTPAGKDPQFDTSAIRNAPLETKLKALEGLDQHLRDLLNGTSDVASVKVSIGDQQITAHGLNDYIAKLQGLEAQLQRKSRTLDE